jgi:hypothetical protein
MKYPIATALSADHLVKVGVRQVGEKWRFDDYSYLCKGLT